MVLISIFLVNNETEYFSFVYWPFGYILFCEMPIPVSCLFFHWIFHTFFFLIYWNPSYTLSVSLSPVMAETYFSSSDTWIAFCFLFFSFFFFILLLLECKNQFLKLYFVTNEFSRLIISNTFSVDFFWIFYVKSHIVCEGGVLFLVHCIFKLFSPLYRTG